MRTKLAAMQSEAGRCSTLAEATLERSTTKKVSDQTNFSCNRLPNIVYSYCQRGFRRPPSQHPQNVVRRISPTGNLLSVILACYLWSPLPKTAEECAAVCTAHVAWQLATCLGSVTLDCRFTGLWTSAAAAAAAWYKADDSRSWRQDESEAPLSLHHHVASIYHLPGGTRQTQMCVHAYPFIVQEPHQDLEACFRSSVSRSAIPKYLFLCVSVCMREKRQGEGERERESTISIVVGHETTARLFAIAKSALKSRFKGSGCYFLHRFRVCCLILTVCCKIQWRQCRTTQLYHPADFWMILIVWDGLLASVGVG